MPLEPTQLLDMYRRMATIRIFDEKAVDEYHAGNIPGNVHAYIGQEAVAVGVCSALRREDQITGTHPGPRPYHRQRRGRKADDGRDLRTQQRLLPR